MNAEDIFEHLEQFGLLNLAKAIDGVVEAIQTHVLHRSHVDHFPKLLDTLQKIIQYGSSCKCQTMRVELQEKTSMVVNCVCIPLFTKILSATWQNQNIANLLSRTCSLMKICLKIAADSSVLNVLQICLDKFHSFDLTFAGKRTETDSYSIDIYHILEILLCVVSNFSFKESNDDRKTSKELNESLESSFNSCLQHLSLLEDKRSQNILLSVLTNMLELADCRSNKLTAIWQEIQNIFNCDKTGSQAYSLLCNLANFYFPLSNVTDGIDLKCLDAFWQVIQTGLSSTNTLIRKQCLYLLKRIVDICEKANIDAGICPAEASCSLFWWKVSESCRILKIWEDFILLFETLEEKQVHVIKPLLSRLQSLVKATAVSDLGYPMIHSSWLTVIFSRSSHHESIFILRWTAQTVLSLDLSTCPMLEQGQDQYFTGPFLCFLQESRLFVRPPDSPLGTCPAVGSGLHSFFQMCWNCLGSSEKQSKFVGQILSTLLCNVWGPVPLLFIVNALSGVPPSPLLDNKAVKQMREIMSTSLLTMDSYSSSVIQYFCCCTLVNLLDLNSVTPDEFSAILIAFSHEESFQRGTSSWKELVEWLRKSCESDIESWSKDNLCRLLDSSVQNYLRVDSDEVLCGTRDECSKIARLILLAADAGLLTMTRDPETKSLSLETLIGHPCHVIHAINSHAYMSATKADKAVDLLVSLINHLGSTVKDELAETVHMHVRGCMSETNKFIGQRITEDITQLSHLPSLNVYQSAVRYLVPCVSHNSPLCLDELGLISLRLSSLRCDSESVTIETRMKQLSGMVLLGEMASLLSEMKPEVQSVQGSLSDLIIQHSVTMEPCLSLKKPTLSGWSQKDWGMMASQYFYSQWSVFHFMSQRGHFLDNMLPLEMLEAGLEVLSLGSADIATPVFGCMKYLLPKILETNGPQIVEDTMDIAWKRVKESKHSHFWSYLHAFIPMVFQPTFLKLSADSEIYLKINQIADVLLTFGEEKMGVVNMLVTHLCQLLSESDMVDHLHKYCHFLVKICIFGPVPNRTQRQWLDLCAYLQKLDIAQTSLASRTSCHVRANTVNFLCQWRPDVPQHQLFITGLIRALQESYDSICRTHTCIYFSNCQPHRQKHRLTQFIVLLEPFIKEDLCEDVWEFVWASLTTEFQPSVRHMLEWLAMAMATRFTKFVQDLWVKMQKFAEKKNIALCSLFCVISHLGPHFSHSQKQMEFYNESLNLILPWCMAHHFNSRVHAQATLIKIWDQCKNQNLQEILQAHSIIEQCIDFTDQNHNSIRNVKKLLENYFFHTFHCKRDFSVETIFHTIPKLSSLADDEWISPAVFVQLNPAWNHAKYSYISLLNPSDDLSICASGPWRVMGQVDDAAAAAGGNEGGEDWSVFDVQKKIMPWRLMNPDEGIQEELEYSSKSNRESGLVLVTSLIDKVPNLGGLCRTSEIFGVSEFVISKLKYTEDKLFQNLSVTAHKWVPITEVSPRQLFDYLQHKRRDGYTLVGAEQTANSVCLTNYKFPVKTLLLLGNEKEGIPVDLINVLDVCVEIPQQGVIRSLNVHVSGALLVWEYRRQQLVQEVQAG